MSRTQQAQVDADVAKRAQKAVKQLDKWEGVVSPLVSDIAPGLAGRRTVFLLYVSRARLQPVLAADPQLEKVHTHSVTHAYMCSCMHAHTHTHICIRHGNCPRIR